MWGKGKLDKIKDATPPQGVTIIKPEPGGRTRWWQGDKNDAKKYKGGQTPPPENDYCL